MSDVKCYVQDRTAATLAAADEMGADIDGHPVNGPDIPDFLASIGMRPASVADLVAALLNEGGEIVDVRQDATGGDAWPNLKTGRYLVVRLDDEA